MVFGPRCEQPVEAVPRLLVVELEAEAVGVLEKNGAQLVTASAPKPEVVGPLMKDARAIVLRTGIKVTRELLAESPEYVFEIFFVDPYSRILNAE